MIELARGTPARAIMVGDSEIDLRTAKEAQVPSILVSFGYATDSVHELVPDAIIDHFDELVAKASSLLAAPVPGPDQR